ncbi:MAG: hypothetical protein LQ343_004846 [Gyalolechia ehrenbergii]|nr:MAG: hypothetical protein LQ343_004846 [Gyalolechia ehrenbergii]
MQRTVYAISNPYFFSGRAWSGGIPAMAKVYLELIRSVIPSGKFIIGGWSLGGLISLEIASLLSRQNSDLVLLGIVMIDSIYPGSYKKQARTISPFKHFLTDHCRPEMRILCSIMMKQSATMIERWEMPTWSRSRVAPILPLDSKGKAGTDHVTVVEVTVDELNPDSDPLSRSSAITTEDHPEIPAHGPVEYEVGCVGGDHWLPYPPRTVLLRCQEEVPAIQHDEEANSGRHVARLRPRPCWDDYIPGFISVSLDVSGHHFSLFSNENVSRPFYL